MTIDSGVRHVTTKGIGMESQSKFAIGDIVKLKSGGPDMTVRVAPDSSRMYQCQWFAGKKLEAGHFPEGSLERVNLEAK